MKNYLYHIKLFLYRFLILILLFSVSRFLFFLFNINYFESIGFSELIKIHLAGIRFDLSALFYFNILFILLSLIPGNFKNKKFYQRILFTLFFLVNSVLLATNYIDTKFFDFEHKRLTFDFFSSVWLGEDFITLLPEFIKDYWYLIMIWIFMCFEMFRMYPKLNQRKISSDTFRIKELLSQVIIFILLMGIGIVCGRGGFQLKPLRVIHAADYTSAKNIPLVLNTPFTIMKTIGAKSFTPVHYYSSSALDSIYNPRVILNGYDKKNSNVVVIILESFSKEYIGYYNNGSGYTPFLDSIMNESLVFSRAFANGKRSIEALPSIMASLPALTDESYITSKFSSNKINSIASTLSKQNYVTAFFHGGKNGTMGFDTFTKIAGFEKYYGMSEYPNKTDYDGNWGVFDEEYLQYFCNTISEFSEPFMASVFTLTSHHPYEIPKKYDGRFPKGNLKIHESIGYTDYSLMKFFEAAKKTDWYNNTLFIITADHTAQAESEYYKNKLGNYEIPIILYHPNDSSIIGNSEIIAQQSDIYPTVLDYLGIQDTIVCFGKSMFAEEKEHFSVNYINGIYQLIKNDTLLQFNGNNTLAIYDIKSDKLLKNNLVKSSNYKSLETFLKAYIQSYEERLSNNKLTIN